MNVLKMKTFVGTVYYVAPELFAGQYDEKCDVWSIGVISYMLATGRPPFDGDSFKVIEKLVKRKVKFDSREDTHISPDARKFIEALLEKDPEKRPSAEEALKMPWLSFTLHKQRRKSEKSVVPGVVLKKLKSFASQTALKRRFSLSLSSLSHESYTIRNTGTALLLMAHHIAGKDLQRLRTHFESLDKDGSGRITMEELRHGLKMSNLLCENEESSSSSSSSKLSDVEIAEKNMEKNQVTQIGSKELKRVFEMLDQDNTGRIQLTQFMVRKREISHSPKLELDCHTTNNNRLL